MDVYQLTSPIIILLLGILFVGSIVTGDYETTKLIVFIYIAGRIIYQIRRFSRNLVTGSWQKYDEDWLNKQLVTNATKTHKQPQKKP